MGPHHRLKARGQARRPSRQSLLRINAALSDIMLPILRLSQISAQNPENETQRDPVPYPDPLPVVVDSVPQTPTNAGPSEMLADCIVA
jgi:hypothetical protein